MRKMVLPDALKSIITNEVDVWYGVILIFPRKNQSSEKGGDTSANGRSRQICRMSSKM